MQETTTYDIYKVVSAAIRADASLEDDLLADFAGTLKRRFGVAVPVSCRLERQGDGFRLVLGDRTYDIGNPRAESAGDLDDSALDLVSGGNDGSLGQAQGKAPTKQPYRS